MFNIKKVIFIILIACSFKYIKAEVTREELLEEIRPLGTAYVKAVLSQRETASESYREDLNREFQEAISSTRLRDQALNILTLAAAESAAQLIWELQKILIIRIVMENN